MPYTIPTAAQFKTRFPEFAAVADATVSAVLTEASSHVSGSWIEADYQPGLMLYAAHLMTLDKLGTSSEAALIGFQSMSVGSLSLSLRDGGVVASGVSASTSYGRRYLDLVRRNSPGILAV